jgi:phage tail-like protein
MSDFVPELMTPFHAFRFQVDFKEHPLGGDPGRDDLRLCSGSFSECSGLEATMEPKVINEGGRNYGAAQRAGRVTFGTVVFKRGMTSSRDLWRWFELVSMGSYAYRLTAEVTVLGPGAVRQEGDSGADAGRAQTADGAGPVTWRWQLLHCLPVKFKAADLDAKGEDVAVEELHVVHEGLLMVQDGAGQGRGRR